MDGDDMKEIAMLVFICLVAVLCVIGLAVFVNNATCNQFAELNPTIETQFRLLGGCYAKIDGMWIPTGQLRGMQ